MTIGFIGNPNCGKTTLFNAYTGANLKVANWPGVTVEKVEGAIKDHDLNIRLVDLPGTYSLTSYTMEEQVSRQFILSDEVDVIIDVADASALERNLYLTLQLLELGKPVVLALNMMDIVEKRGMEIDTQAAGNAGHPGHSGFSQKANRPGCASSRSGTSQGLQRPGVLDSSPQIQTKAPARPSFRICDGLQRRY